MSGERQSKRGWNRKAGGLLLPEAEKHLGQTGDQAATPRAGPSAGKLCEDRKAPFLKGARKGLNWKKIHFTSGQDVLETEVPETELFVWARPAPLTAAQCCLVSPPWHHSICCAQGDQLEKARVEGRLNKGTCLPEGW